MCCGLCHKQAKWSWLAKGMKIISHCNVYFTCKSLGGILAMLLHNRILQQPLENPRRVGKIGWSIQLEFLARENNFCYSWIHNNCQSSNYRQQHRSRFDSHQLSYVLQNILAQYLFSFVYSYCKTFQHYIFFPLIRDQASKRHLIQVFSSEAAAVV